MEFLPTGQKKRCI